VPIRSSGLDRLQQCEAIRLGDGKGRGEIGDNLALIVFDARRLQTEWRLQIERCIFLHARSDRPYRVMGIKNKYGFFRIRNVQRKTKLRHR
jgi:hypothetical protein